MRVPRTWSWGYSARINDTWKGHPSLVSWSAGRSDSLCSQSPAAMGGPGHQLCCGVALALVPGRPTKLSLAKNGFLVYYQ